MYDVKNSLRASDFNWYCSDNGVSMEWIEERATYLLENFIDVDSVYMSEDIYHKFMQSMMTKTRYNSNVTSVNVPTVAQIITSSGPLAVRMVPGLTNFCHVGTNTSYSDLVRIHIDEEFERIVLRDCERE